MKTQAFPKVNSVWYIESKEGPDNWYQVMRVTFITQPPKTVHYDVVETYGFVSKDKGANSLKKWHLLDPKDVTDDHPEYLL